MVAILNSEQVRNISEINDHLLIFVSTKKKKKTMLSGSNVSLLKYKYDTKYWLNMLRCFKRWCSDRDSYIMSALWQKSIILFYFIQQNTYLIGEGVGQDSSKFWISVQFNVYLTVA